MRRYELVFILRPDLEEEALDAAIAKVRSLAENNGAEVTKLDKWGKRRLAYEIKHVRDGFYVVMNFNGEPESAAEIDRVLKISDEILRHIIVREDEDEK
ncbi:30S ribosomal protein S6 [Desulfotruncus alcoholivorax]|uniref:30S ribosomal protein S6 n=1 Tax=Desulfotruncus alcoholivorax TaxID=265477 RepID=UPI00041F7070|nr:30S ribosomal protein S6 [Desulfotruncus alcoholivorax]